MSSDFSRAGSGQKISANPGRMPKQWGAAAVLTLAVVDFVHEL